jgi:NADPH2:quinone reductase
LYPGAGELPLTVGRDGAGVVEHAPEGSRFAVGDEVVILRSEIGITRQGTLAEYVAAPEAVVAPLPAGWSLEEGAAAPLVYLTAWKALVTQGHLKSRENVLVTGASGGVGIAAVQLANALGATVAALSRDAAKRDELLALGAHAAIDSNADDLENQVSAALKGGVDLVIDNLAGPFVQKYMNMANLNARIMVIGLLAGRTAELQLGLLLFKQTRIEGVHVGKFTPSEAQSAWASIVETLARAEARPSVAKVFSMEQVQEAFAHLRGGHLGKVLVDVGSQTN